MRIGHFGHMYIPVSMGSMRSVTRLEKDGVRVTLVPAKWNYVARLFVMPKEYWKLVFRDSGPTMAFFRKDGDKLTSLVPFAKEG
jgi:hypothetical protein